MLLVTAPQNLQHLQQQQQLVVLWAVVVVVLLVVHPAWHPS